MNSHHITSKSTYEVNRLCSCLGLLGRCWLGRGTADTRLHRCGPTERTTRPDRLRHAGGQSHVDYPSGPTSRVTCHGLSPPELSEYAGDLRYPPPERKCSAVSLISYIEAKKHPRVVARSFCLILLTGTCLPAGLNFGINWYYFTY